MERERERDDDNMDDEYDDDEYDDDGIIRHHTRGVKAHIIYYGKEGKWNRNEKTLSTRTHPTR